MRVAPVQTLAPAFAKLNGGVRRGVTAIRVRSSSSAADERQPPETAPGACRSAGAINRKQPAPPGFCRRASAPMLFDPFTAI
ncbi:hypothetical protein [Lysobacter gummosus]|uniref:hypothetical protein n=1 Tax=Lysobacter gummosus TaxID=262324 RepID=UPI00363C1729